MNQELIMDSNTKIVNKSTLIISKIVGILLAISGFEHGLFESLHGNIQTESLIIQSIPQNMQKWEGGSEEAFTLIPNYLVTGILAMSISVFIIIWVIFFLTSYYGKIMLRILFILLTLVGGGIGYTPVFISLLIYTSKIDQPLNAKKYKDPNKVMIFFSKIWPFTLIIATLTWSLLIEIAIWGYFPGVNATESLMNIVWICLFSTLILVNVSFLSGYAKDGMILQENSKMES